MPDKHLSSQFDADLNSICGRLLEMGGLVESQVSVAMRAFTQLDAELADQVIAREHDVIFYPFFLDGVATQRDLNQADGIHPNEKGVEIVVRNILPSVEQLLARVKPPKQAG